MLGAFQVLLVWASNMLATPPSILVVGGGLTGAAVCRALCRNIPADNLVVWEAADTIGGRFATERPTSGGACDTGAQYVTVTDNPEVAKEHASLYNELESKGTLLPMQGRIEGKRAADGGETACKWRCLHTYFSVDAPGLDSR